MMARSNWMTHRSMNDARRRLAEQLREYAGHTVDADAGAFLALLADADAFLRARLDGHFTGSAWLVSADGRRALLMHHRKLDRWLQPGGHADGEEDLAAVALREAQEESGLRDLVVEPAIFDIDRHFIPAREEVPGHWHFDVRHVVRAGGDERFAANGESLALAWRDIATLVQDGAIDPSIARMARRWLARGG